jgi:hypothetical protein
VLTYDWTKNGEQVNSERGAPECSSQRSPLEAPHVGQRTADSCLGVSSFLFIEPECENTRTRVYPILNTFVIRRNTKRLSNRARLLVKNHTEERTMHLQSTVIVNEAQLSEFVHENIHMPPKSPDLCPESQRPIVLPF